MTEIVLAKDLRAGDQWGELPCLWARPAPTGGFTEIKFQGYPVMIVDENKEFEITREV